MVAPSSPKNRHSHCPTPPAAPVMAMVLPANAPLISASQCLADPCEIASPQVAPIVECNLFDTPVPERLHRGEKFLLGGQVGICRPDDAAYLRLSAAEPPAKVEQVGFHPHGSRLVEARLDDDARFRQ